MKSSLSLPNIAGIALRIHWTFSLLIAYIVYTNLKAGLDVVQVGWMVLFVLSLFACVTLHELGHALAARRYGIATRDITLYPIGGVARLERMPEKPAQELVVALAGPMVNVIIAAFVLLFTSIESLVATDGAEVLVIGPENFIPMLGIVNITLAVFNLIPAFPMDGGRVLRALLSLKLDRVKSTTIAANIGKVVAVGFIIVGAYMNPMMIIIGVFIILGAQGEAEAVKNQSYISPYTARDVLMTQYRTLDKYAPISEAIRLLLDGEAKNFLITDNGQPFGVVTRDHIIRGIREKGEQSPLVQIADLNLIRMETNTALSEMYAEFQRTGMPLILITHNGSMVGIVDAENILEFIMIHEARGKS